MDQAAAPRQVPGELVVADGTICINVLGHAITAAPRPVKANGAYAIEYEFKVPFNGECLPIWRMYLWEGGVLTEGQSIDSARVCDFNNRYVKQHLVLSVTNALLQSPVFQPSASGVAS